jgi:hypothetical protein
MHLNKNAKSILKKHSYIADTITPSEIYYLAEPMTFLGFQAHTGHYNRACHISIPAITQLLLD